MNRDERKSIPERLKHLQKVVAPGDFETSLYHQIRAVRSGNRYWNWLFRPIPATLVLTGCALFVAAFLAIPNYFNSSNPVSGQSNIALPVKKNHGNSSSDRPLIPRTATDTLRADSMAAKRNDVNTSKMP